ncbi:Hypothetical predicted protein [Pelobates cultripes]|uniref:Uncharacterized protein n=1 Tax=Pelobates cultripes TaxID=61616 RepID=A0AAD1R4T2_PELCU|nr:Hypothetical predicted protein [Pelobates cultripes]
MAEAMCASGAASGTTSTYSEFTALGSAYWHKLARYIQQPAKCTSRASAPAREQDQGRQQSWRHINPALKKQWLTSVTHPQKPTLKSVQGASFQCQTLHPLPGVPYSTSLSAMMKLRRTQTAGIQQDYTKLMEGIKHPREHLADISQGPTSTQYVHCKIVSSVMCQLYFTEHIHD